MLSSFSGGARSLTTSTYELPLVCFLGGNSLVEGSRQVRTTFWARKYPLLPSYILLVCAIEPAMERLTPAFVSGGRRDSFVPSRSTVAAHSIADSANVRFIEDGAFVLFAVGPFGADLSCFFL